jgi:hypothetical protein
LSKGNSGTNPSSAVIGTTVNNDFIGTTDTKDVVLASNNLERMRISSQGNILIGTSASVTNAKLSINDGHIQISQSTAPTISVSTNAGTGATALLTSKSNDVVGNIVFTSGNGAISSGSQCTVTFFKPYTSPPIVILTPTNRYTAWAMSNKEIFPLTSTTGFTITFGVLPNASPVGHEWNYMVIEP